MAHVPDAFVVSPFFYLSLNDAAIARLGDYDLMGAR